MKIFLYYVRRYDARCFDLFLIFWDENLRVRILHFQE